MLQHCLLGLCIVCVIVYGTPLGEAHVEQRMKVQTVWHDQRAVYAQPSCLRD